MSEFQHLRKLVEERRREHGLKSNTDSFVRLCLERVLNLTESEIEESLTHGELDGGIDALRIDGSGVHIILCDYAEAWLDSHRPISRKRLENFFNTWLAIVCDRDSALNLNRKLRLRIKDIKAYWKKSHNGDILLTFYFLTNRRYTAIPRASTERRLNYYMTHTYRYFEQKEVAGTLLATSDNDATTVLRKALALEEADAHNALRLFRQFERQRALWYFDLLPLAILSPVLVTIVMYYMGRLAPPFGRWLVMAVLFSGYAPFYFAFLRREVARGFKPGSKSTRIFWFLASVLYMQFETVIGAVIILAIALIIAVFTIVPISLVIPAPPTAIEFTIELAVLLLALAVVFSGLIGHPLSGLRYVPGEVVAGVKRNVGELIGFAAGLAQAAFLVGGGYFGLIYKRFWESLLAGSIAGLMTGLRCRSRVARKPELYSLDLLGQARCLLRLGRWADGSRRLREVFEAESFSCPYPIEKLAEAISAFEGRWLGDRRKRNYAAQHELDLAEKASVPADVPYDIWEASLDKTWHLLAAKPQRGKSAEELLAMIGDPDVPAWQRVCIAEALSQKEDPRFYRDRSYCGLPADPLLGFVKIPKGPVKMASGEKLLPDYYMGRFPVTKGQVSVFFYDHLGDAKIKHFHSLVGPDSIYSQPFTGMRWSEAVTYCQWLEEKLKLLAKTKSSARTREERLFWSGLASGDLTVTLPSEAEWEKAARGVDERRYPWGEVPDPNRANFAETGIHAVVPVGCFPTGRSPYGIEDLLGSGLSWTRSRFYESCSEPSDVQLSPWNSHAMTVRGTEPFWPAGRLDLSRREPYDADHFFGVGLRIVLAKNRG